MFIDGQKVSTNYGCVKAGADDNTNTEVYLIKTAAGKKFAYDSFVNNNFTFVKFEEVEIPFDTAGFLGVWEEANEPAL